jgi:L,D-transpeptidase YcbB
LLAVSTPVALVAAGVPAVAQSAPGETTVAQSIRDRGRGDVKRFYATRDYRPLWTVGDRIGPSADKLIGYLETADLDGLKPGRYRPEALREAVAKSRGGDPRAVAEADLQLSAAFARYVRDQRQSRTRIIWADPSLKPGKLKADAVLRAAAFPKSLAGYVTDMGWMSPHYVRLRELVATAAKQGATAEAMERLHLNLDRARLLPGPWTGHVVVDASSGRLWYYEAGKQVGTMRVVVGATETQTPMMAGSLTWAILNPYWNIPTYLARKSVAPKVLAGRSLKSLNMEALTGWEADAQPLAASAIDWRAVADGRQEVRLRELPGAGNSMGRVKFLFPNDEGIYLHDTPDRALLTKEDRHFSNGCIRLEKAAELGRWLLQRPLPPRSKDAEKAVHLPVSVPVYLTYLTATPIKAGVGFRPDVYGRDT